MTTATTQPTYAVTNRETPVTFTKTNASANFIRVWVTDAPLASELKSRLEETAVSRLKVHEGDNLSVWNVNFDRGGRYRFVAQEYTLFAADYGGAYEMDPNAAPAQDKVGGETELSIYIGQKMVSTVGAGGDTADLTMYIWNDTVRGTTIANHGFISPVIDNPSSPRASSAIASTDVITALANLSDVNVATMIGDVSTINANIITKYNAHLTQVSVHENDDDDNAVDSAYAEDQTPDTLAKTGSNIISLLKRHFTNDGGLGPGTSGTDPSAVPADIIHEPYHDVSGAKYDLTNEPLFNSVSGTAEGYRGLADLWRAYEAHRVSTAVHDVADTTNTLTTLPLLLLVHKAFFAQLAAISPDVPDTQSSGAVILMAQTGAIES